MKYRSDNWQELEHQLRKPRKKRPKVKVSGRSVLKLREIIAKKYTKRASR